MSSPGSARVLCRLGEIPDGDCIEVHVDDRSLMVARSGEQVWAYVNVCPHFSLPLNSQPNEFLVVGERRVMCAYHCAIFRFDDGHCIEGPAEGLGLEPVAVDVVDGEVVLRPAGTNTHAASKEVADAAGSAPPPVERGEDGRGASS